MKMILFTESPIPTKYPHPSLLMNYGCLGLCSTRNLAGLCKTIFWRVCFILNEEGRQEASRIKMDPLFKTLYLKLTKHSSSCHFVSLSCFSPEPFSSLQPVLSCMLGIFQVHWWVPTTRPGQNQKLTDGRTRGLCGSSSHPVTASILPALASGRCSHLSVLSAHGKEFLRVSLQNLKLLNHFAMASNERNTPISLNVVCLCAARPTGV